MWRISLLYGRGRFCGVCVTVELGWVVVWVWVWSTVVRGLCVLEGRFLWSLVYGVCVMCPGEEYVFEDGVVSTWRGLRS